MAIHIGVIFFGKGSNIKVDKNTVINSNVIIDGRGKIEIGENCSISRNVSIITLGHEPDDKSFALKAGKVTIGKDVWIGIGAIILPGIDIGDAAIIGAGSVVTKDVPKGSIVAGNPAKFIRKRSIEELTVSVYYNPPFGHLS